MKSYVRDNVSSDDTIVFVELPIRLFKNLIFLSNIYVKAVHFDITIVCQFGAQYLG